jgi:uncharacterized membrane protein YraQ (UPF0718 family)
VLNTALRKKRLIGVLLLVALMATFITFNRAPKLDTVREDIDESAGVAAAEVERFEDSEEFAEAAAGQGGAGLQLLCFQGYCATPEPDTTFLSRWWDFSLTYLKLVTIGMIFAFSVAGLTEVFLFPKSESGGGFSGRGFRGTLKGLAAGTPMTLCSACIVPIANAVRRRGGQAETVVAMVQGSATLNLPALIMLFVVFSPWMAGARIGLSVAGALILGPLVALAAGQRSRPEPIMTPVVSVGETATWGTVIREGARDWVLASFGYLLRLGPIMVVAALLSGLVIQWISVDVVDDFLGDNVLGILIAAAVGVLINVPLLFEIPLVALLLVLGAGTAPAATLLFTAAAAGPITFWGLARVMPKRAVATFGVSTWALGVLGGLLVLGISMVVDEDGFSVRDGVVSEPSAVEAAVDVDRG